MTTDEYDEGTIKMTCDVLKVTLLSDTAIPPVRKHQNDAGVDLFSPVETSLAPGERWNAPFDLAVEIPDGYVGMMCSRSGMAMRGISVYGAPGIIDSGYRGCIRVNLINLAQERVDIHVGDRIAQLLVVPITLPRVEVVESLSESTDGRGDGGFGSTGR